MFSLVTEIISETEETTVDVFTRLVENRIVFIYDYVDDTLATDVVSSLLYLDSIDNQKISLFINSEGGDLRAVFMIYDIINLLTSPVETICIGAAHEEAAILLAAGRKGMRFATKSSTICLNQHSHSETNYSDLKNAKISLDLVNKDNKSIIAVLSKITNKSTKIINKDCERRLFMSSVQAKKYGIIDKIIDSIKELNEKV